MRRFIIGLVAAAALLPLDLGGWPCAKAFAATISTAIDDVSVPLGNATLTIKRMELTGASGSDIVALVDPASRTPIVDRLRGVQASSITIPDAVLTLPLGGPLLTLTAHDIRLVEVVRGRIGAMSIGHLDIGAKADERMLFAGHTGEISGRNLDPVLVARVFTQARAASGEALSVLFDNLAVEDVEFESKDDIKLTLERFRSGGLALRALGVPVVAIEDRFRSTGGEPGGFDAKEHAQFALSEDWLASFALGRIELHGFNFASNLGPSFAADRIMLDDPADNRRGTFSLETGRIATRHENYRLHEARFEGLDVPQITRAVLFAAGLAPRNGRETAASLLRALVPRFDRILVNGFVVEISNRMASPTGTPLRIDHVDVETADPINGIPSAITMAAHGITLDVNSFGVPLFNSLREAGYQSVALQNGRVELAWNPALRTLRLAKLHLDLAGMGRISGSATVANADADLFSRLPVVEEAALFGVMFKNATIEVVNAGLMEKSLAAVAHDRSTTVAEVKQRGIDELSTHLPQELGDSPKATKIVGAVVKFFDNPGSLTLTATSAEGVPIPAIMLAKGPSGLLDLIDVTASASAPPAAPDPQSTPAPAAPAELPSPALPPVGK